MNLSLIKQNAKNILSNNKCLYGYTFLYFLILVVGGFILGLIPIIGFIGTFVLSIFMSLLAIGFTYQLSNGNFMNVNGLIGKFEKFFVTYIWYILYFWPVYLIAFATSAVGMIMAMLAYGSDIAGILSGIIMIGGSVFAIYYEIKLVFDFAVAYYVAVDDSASNLSAKDCLKTSKEMMKGHKMEFFMLSLSFFGWFLLTGITFGLAGLYVLPYYQLSIANFYNEIKSDYMNRSRYNYQ